MHVHVHVHVLVCVCVHVHVLVCVCTCMAVLFLSVVRICGISFVVCTFNLSAVGIFAVVFSTHS